MTPILIIKSFRNFWGGKLLIVENKVIVAADTYENL